MRHSASPSWGILLILYVTCGWIVKVSVHDDIHTSARYKRSDRETNRFDGNMCCTKDHMYPNGSHWGLNSDRFYAFIIIYMCVWIDVKYYTSITKANATYISLPSFMLADSACHSEIHDDVIKWKHFPRCWPFVRGIHRSTVNSPQRPVTRRFDVFFDLRLSKRLSKQSWGWWFETLPRPLWHHSNVTYLKPHWLQIDNTSLLGY